MLIYECFDLTAFENLNLIEWIVSAYLLSHYIVKKDRRQEIRRVPSNKMVALECALILLDTTNYSNGREIV